MSTKKQHISNKAVDLSALGFKTLWQEATKSLNVIGDTITRGIALTETTKQQHDILDLKDRMIWSQNILNNKQTNTGFYIVISILLIAILAFAFIILKNKK